MKKVVILGFGLMVILAGCTNPLAKNKVEKITIDQAKVKAAQFINDNLMQAGSEVSIKEVIEEYGMYKITVNLPTGQEVTAYMTEDGKKFFPQVMDVAEVEQANQGKGDTAAEAQTAEIKKTDKPSVELYVMAFCPYGVQAEKAMQPVVDLLGGKADIKVRYIASISGNDLNSVSSLHGVIEGKEDARQLCVAKNYDTKTLWSYISTINEKCYPVYSKGEAEYDKCWKDAAKTAGVDSKKIETCTAQDGVALIKAENESNTKNSVSGSPTLLINGTKYNGSRTAEGYKTAICGAFNAEPAECSKTLSTETTNTSSGGCN